jgi:hypothetical protein
MTLTLPRIDSHITGPDGKMTRDWYKALTTSTTSLNGILSGQTIYTDTGAVNALVIASGAKTLTKGLVRYIVPAHTNTSTSVTLNDSGLGAKQIVIGDGVTVPAVGQIVIGQTIQVIYDGIRWELQASSAANQSINGNLQVAGTLQVTGATTLTGGVTGAMAATGAVSGDSISATNAVSAGTYSKTGSTTVGALPAAGTAGAGARYFVTDANATTFLSVVAAGGANKVPVVSDGTNWRIG